MLTRGQWVRITPLLVFFLFCVVMATGLIKGHPKPTQEMLMLGKKIALPTLPVLGDSKKTFSVDALRGNVYVLNVFASWCEPCKQEHATLINLAKALKAPIYGIDWKDKPQNVAQWLKIAQNPYQIIAYDPSGATTVPLAITGVPETYIIDKEGIIRFHTRLPLTEAMVEKSIIPLIDRLNSASPR